MRPKLHAWRGKPIDDLSRDELIDVVNWYADRWCENYTLDVIHERAVGRARVLAHGVDRSD